MSETKEFIVERAVVERIVVKAKTANEARAQARKDTACQVVSREVLLGEWVEGEDDVTPV